MEKYTRAKALSAKVASSLLEDMKTGIYSTSNRLPTELELSIHLNVSRSVVRDALSILEMEGYVSRKRGSGTTINRNVLKVKIRIDLELEFMEIVRAAGFYPEITNVVISTCNPPEKVARKLLIRNDEDVYMVSRVITADKIPTIYCADYFSKRLINSKSYDEKELEGPIFEFLDKYCDQQVSMDLSEVHAIVSNDDVAKKLDLAKGVAVLNLKETGYNYDGTPILFSDEYYREGMLTHTILRKNIDFLKQYDK